MTKALLSTAKMSMTPNYSPPDMVLDKGRGTRVWDTEGREYLDFAGGIGVLALGHGHPKVVDAIREQATLLQHVSNMFYHKKHIEMCAKLASLSFGQKVYFANSGTEAIEACIKLARWYFFSKGTPRTQLVSTINSFHGRTLGSLSLTGQPKLQEGFGPLLPNVTNVSYGDTDAMQQAVNKQTAAVVIECIQGNGGVLVAPPGYLAAVRDICTQAGTLLIFDEVQTGIGRTGKWFAHEHDEVLPDIMAVAKMLGGGLPLGAMITTDEFANVLEPGSHASTFGGNPVACAAGLATIEAIRQEELLSHATRMGEFFQKQLTELAREFPNRISEVRGRGLMIGLKLKEPAKPLCRECVKHGLLTTIAGSEVLRFLPPLNVSKQEIEETMNVLQTVFQ